MSISGPVWVTFAYFCLWYGMLFGLQRQTKYRLQKEYANRGEVFDRYFGRDERMLAVDRAVINTQEQMVPFLVAFWLEALLVSTTIATMVGSLYVVLRSIYPFLLGGRLSHMNPKKVYFVTFPCYGIIFFCFVSVLVKLSAN